MVNIETKQKVGVQYQIETDLPASYNHPGLKMVLEDIPHVQVADFNISGHAGSVYVDYIITVDATADDRFLWKAIQRAFIEAGSRC